MFSQIFNIGDYNIHVVSLICIAQSLHTLIQRFILSLQGLLAGKFN